MQIYPNLNSKELQDEVCRIVSDLGLAYEIEVYSAINSSIIGKRRRVDVVIRDEQGTVLMHIECKSQNSAGTAEDKLFKAVEEANRDKRHGIPSIIVFSGFGFNEADMRHALLNGAVRIEMLQDWLKIYFLYKKQNPACLEGELESLQQPQLFD